MFRLAVALLALVVLASAQSGPACSFISVLLHEHLNTTGCDAAPVANQTGVVKNITVCGSTFGYTALYAAYVPSSNSIQFSCPDPSSDCASTVNHTVVSFPSSINTPVTACQVVYTEKFIYRNHTGCYQNWLCPVTKANLTPAVRQMRQLEGHSQNLQAAMARHQLKQARQQ